MSLFFEDALEQRSFFFQDPVEQIIVRDLEGVVGAFAKMEDYRKQGFYLAGYVAYEAGFAFFPRSTESPRPRFHPLIHFGVFKEKKNTTWLEHEISKSPVIYNVTFDTNYEEYVHQQKLVQKNLWAGNIYQLNQTFQMSFRCNLEAQKLYEHLKRLQPTHFCAFLQFEDCAVLSLSPELFYQKEGVKITAQPMKGTLALGQDPKNLIEDEKTIAENLMIVDLLRNDLGKIAKPGSVHVENLFSVQQLSTIQQMTSTVCCEVDESTSVGEIFSSLFPCGSITGAPKWSAMQEIARLEKTPRGVYTGAIGFIEPNNNQCFSVAIRTLFNQGERYSMGLGGGVVVDSIVDHEYKEAHLKSRFVRKSNDHFFLFETILFDGLEWIYLEEHLTRLQASARFYNFEIDQKEILHALDKIKKQLQGEKILKLQLFWDGEMQLSLKDLIALPPQRRVIFSSIKIDTKNPFQGHKTSNRLLYDQEWTRAQEEGFYDVLFLNEREELVEASRHNLFLRINGQWWTPPLSSGALPGIERRQVLEEGRAIEKSLCLEDLFKSEEVMLTNSVRGRVIVQWEPV